MAQLLNIAFKKNDLYTSWGFQICGGMDSWRPLAVRNVQSGTLACNYLTVGDRILEIDGVDCYSLTESQAISFLRRPSRSIELLVLKRRGESAAAVAPPKRSSSCKAFQNFAFPTTTPQAEPKTAANGWRSFSDLSGSGGYSPQTNGEPVQCSSLRSRSSSPQFWKTNREVPAGTSGGDCRSFWRKMEKKCSMEDLRSTRRRTPSPARPASVAFCPRTAEPTTTSDQMQSSPKKKVTFSNVLLERNYLQLELPDLSPGSRVDEEFNKIYNSSGYHQQHQIGAKNLAGDDMQSAPPPPAPPPLPPPPSHSGGMVQGGPAPPPPPPPMLHSGHIPAIRIKTELNEPREIPSTIQNAMATKDKKPFTYLPGGLDLSEIKSPRMQRRLERNAQTPPSPEQVPQKSPDYQPQQVQKPNFESPKPVCNVRPASERVCLLPQVQQQPQLHKAPTPWLQKAAQVQPNTAPWAQNKNDEQFQPNPAPWAQNKNDTHVQPSPAPWAQNKNDSPVQSNPAPWAQNKSNTHVQSKPVQRIQNTNDVHVQPNTAPWAQNRNGHVDQVDKSEDRVIPIRIETSRQTPPVPLKNNINHSYESEPIQGRSFKVLQQITEPKSIYDGTQPYNSQSLPLSELRKLQLSDDDRSFMNKVKSQVDDDKFLHNETDPRYRGASIPSRSFRILQTLTNSAPVPMDNCKQSAPVHHYVSVEPVESKIYVPPSERPAGTEPHKYTGGSIPSRSFRMLQAMTGQNNGHLGESDF